MFVIKVKNKSPTMVNVPLSKLVPGARQAVEQAAPDAEASCVFAPPTSSGEAQDAILAWAQTAGVDIDMVIEISPLPVYVSAPVTEVMIDHSNPLGL